MGKYRDFQFQQQRVDDESCSEASAPLDDLDWANWFTDDSHGDMYLHVDHKDGQTTHRVTCLGSTKPRLKLQSGILYWLY